jgi:ssDNA-binding Zn-finger/Zn-ribbon topoisomerase 1
MEAQQKTICQSCGMPMISVPDFGTNSDGSSNEEYCKYCFHNGEFKDQGISLEQKIKKNILMAVEMGMKESDARKMANAILPKLKRWRK